MAEGGSEASPIAGYCDAAALRDANRAQRGDVLTRWLVEPDGTLLGVARLGEIGHHRPSIAAADVSEAALAGSACRHLQDMQVAAEPRLCPEPPAPLPR
jgi:hypothetical protein